jgi:hypothetical protein
MDRLVAGLSSGLAVCLVPPFLSVIARSTPELVSKTGLIGTMNQIGIVTGLFCGQLAGLILTGSVSVDLKYEVGLLTEGERGCTGQLEVYCRFTRHCLGSTGRHCSQDSQHHIRT